MSQIPQMPYGSITYMAPGISDLGYDKSVQNLDSLYELPVSIIVNEEQAIILSKTGHMNSNWRTTVALTKSMVGTFVLYLPFLLSKAGLLLGGSLLLTIAVLSTFCMYLVSECSDTTGCQHYGEIGALAIGVLGESAVDLSILLSQLGYCIAYYTYVSTNIISSFPSIQNNSLNKSNILTTSTLLIILQVLVYVPLSWFRRLSHLSKTLLFANIFIFTGFFVTFLYSTYNLIQTGPKPVQLCETDGIPLFISSAIIAFEGMGLVLPIKHAMIESNSFNTVLFQVMSFLATLYLCFSVCTYYSYGADTKRFATLNLPENALAINIIERYIYPISMLKNNMTKTIKNVVRTLVVIFTAFVATHVSTERFDNFVTLIVVRLFVCLAVTVYLRAIVPYNPMWT
eukprot:gene1571-3038_t